MMTLENYRFHPAHVDKATLLADATSIMLNWTPRTIGVQWLPDSAHVATPYVQRVGGLNGFAYGQGLTVPSAWRMVLTTAMYAYLYGTKFNGAQSTLATIQDYDVLTTAWRVWQVTATLNEQTPDALQPFGRDWLRVVEITFARGEEQT